MKLKNTLFALAATSIAMINSSFAAISAGDISIIGYNASNQDEFRIVFLAGADAGDTLIFTDGGWLNTGGFRSGEGNLTYTVQAGGISAGTTVNWQNGQSIAGTGWSSNNPTNFSFNASGDSLIALTGSIASPSLVYGLQQGASWSANATSAATSSEPTASNSGTLVNRVTTNAFGGVNGYYSGSMVVGTKALLQVATANATNWTTSGSVIANSNFKTSFTVDASASIHWDANGTSAGDGGAGTWDASTNNRFKNGAAGTTYMPWVNSTSGNDHTAVFGGTAGVVTVATGGVTASGLQFDTTGYTLSGAPITLSGTATPSINSASAVAANINSALVGTTGFNKIGSGSLTLGGDSNYSGATNINAGSLIVNGSTGTSSDFTVASGATLGGSGTIGGATTIQSGGTLAVGNSPGTQSFSNGLALASGSIFSWDLDANSVSGRGTNYDAVNVTGGDLTVTAGAVFRVVQNSGVDFDNAFWNLQRNFTDIFSITGGGSISSAWSNTAVSLFNTSGSEITSSRGSFTITGSNLQWTPVPEASNLLVGGLLGLGLMSRRRKQA
jgi:uncharacterized protein